MKKNVMLVALMMVSTIIFAQHPHGDPKAMADKRADRMKKELSLNDDQYGRVKGINEKFAESHVRLRADTALSVGTVRNRMKAMRTEQEAQLKSVLTADQWTKWTALKAKRMEDWKKQKHGKTEKG
jgi:Phage integrase, N-terminal